MRVRFLRQHHTAGRAYFDGQVYDIEAEEAAALIEAGIAEDLAADAPQKKSRAAPPEDKQRSPKEAKQDAPGGTPLSDIAGYDEAGKFRRRSGGGAFGGGGGAE